MMVARKVGIQKQKLEVDISKRIEGRGSIDAPNLNFGRNSDITRRNDSEAYNLGHFGNTLGDSNTYSNALGDSKFSQINK
jgi:hypothetical protein